MKTYIIVLLTAGLLLTGCGTEENEPTPVVKTEEAVNTEPTAPESAPMAKTETLKTEPEPEPEPIIEKTPQIINASDIARKTAKEVAEILGEPLHTEELNFGMGPEFKEQPVTLNHYIEILEEEMGRVEIMFVEGKAHRIRVNLIGEQYDSENRSANLAYVGLPNVKLDPPKSDAHKGQYTNDVEGFYSAHVGDWLGTDDGTILLVTEEAYK